MGAENGTSNDWTCGSLTFMKGHNAKDVKEDNRTLLEHAQLRVSSQQRCSLQTVYVISVTLRAVEQRASFVPRRLFTFI
jgi:hypothetical protein